MLTARPLASASLIVLTASGCSLPPLQEEPWSVTKAGSTGVLARLGLDADVEVESTYSFDSNFGPFEIEDDTDLDPRFEAGLGVEYFLFDDVSLVVGSAWRVFQPESIGDDVIEFDKIREFEGFAGVKWVLPWRLPPSDRVRPFLQVGVGYLPDIDFDATVDLGVPQIPPEDFEFDGSTAWSAGAQAGLMFQISDHWVGQLGFLYEWNLQSADDDVQLDFLDSTLDLDIELEPRGWLLLGGLTYFF